MTLKFYLEFLFQFQIYPFQCLIWSNIASPLINISEIFHKSQIVWDVAFSNALTRQIGFTLVSIKYYTKQDPCSG